MSAVFVSVIVCGNWAAFTPETVATLVRQLNPTSPEIERRRAVSKVYRYAAHPAALAALPALEKLVRSDTSDRVRANALLALGSVAAAHKRPCPEVVFDALYDDGWDGNVRLHAGVALAWLKPLPPGSTEKLIRYATSPKPEHREDGVGLLALHAPDSPAALKVIREATKDPDPQRRHNAYCHLLTATKKIGDVFPHLMSLQAERSETPEPPADAPEKVRRHHQWLSIVNYGMAMFLAVWTQDRTAELRDEVVKALGHESPKVRLATLRLVERFALAVSDEEFLKAITVPEQVAIFPEYDAKKQRVGMKTITTAQAVRQRVKALAEKDSDANVREAADQLLKILGNSE